MKAGDLAALVAAALPHERLTAADVETCCGGPHAEILGEPDAAAVLVVRQVGTSRVAWLLLLAVHPARQRRGAGRALVGAVAQRARELGATELHLGNASPRYVWPGVDYAFTPALALFEAIGFEPYGAECNMMIPTSFRAAAAPGAAVGREDAGGAVELARRACPHWEDEVARGVEHGTCFTAHRDGEVVGFGCHSVNRRGWIGPMATDPTRRSSGIGSAVLGAICADLERQGLRAADIAWVGPVGFYAKCGARVSRVFRTARLRL